MEKGNNPFEGKDNMTELICIAGKQASKNEEIAQALKNELEYRNKRTLITRLSDYTKHICRDMLKWDGIEDRNGCELIAGVGNIVRTLHPDFWVDCILIPISAMRDEWDYVIIPDGGRYIASIQRYGFSLWRMRAASDLPYIELLEYAATEAQRILERV